jgi:predicted O-methyltransferase YrrM
MLFSDRRAQEVFEEYHERHQRELKMMRNTPPGGGGVGRDELLLPVGMNVGNFLRALAMGRGQGTILELGTSYGYSTLFLADAARQADARVISVDTQKDKQDHAAGMLARARLAEFVTFRCGDAVEVINSEPGPFNLVLLDIWKSAYVSAFEALYPKIPEQGIVVSDNMIDPASAREQVREYRAAVQAKGDMQSVLLPLGSGIELSIRWSPDSDKL